MKRYLGKARSTAFLAVLTYAFGCQSSTPRQGEDPAPADVEPVDAAAAPGESPMPQAPAAPGTSSAGEPGAGQPGAASDDDDAPEASNAEEDMPTPSASDADGSSPPEDDPGPVEESMDASVGSTGGAPNLAGTEDGGATAGAAVEPDVDAGSSGSSSGGQPNVDFPEPPYPVVDGELTGSDCPRVDLGSVVPLTYVGDTSGLPDIATSRRLEWREAPDDTLLFRVPRSGAYEVQWLADQSTNGGCGVSVWDRATDSIYDPSWCPAPGEQAVLDGFYTSRGFPFEWEQGQEVLLWISCTYWSSARSGRYMLQVVECASNDVAPTTGCTLAGTDAGSP